MVDVSVEPVLRASSPAGSAEMSCLRALIVEDSSDDLEVIIRCLRAQFLDLETACVAGPEPMRAALRAQPWDIVLCDWEIPGFGAIAAIGIVDELKVEVPVVVVSGTVGEEMAVSAMRAGARDFVAKDRLARLNPIIVRELGERAARLARRRAEEELKAQELRFRALIEASQDAIILLAADGSATYLSPAAERLVGFTLAECPGRKIFELVHPDDSALLGSSMGELMRAPGATVRVEARLVRDDGSVRWVEGDGTNHLDHPAIGAIIGNFRDVTERKRARAVLAASEARFRRMVQTTRQGVWEIDAAQRTVFANAQMAAMLGTSVQAMIGEPIARYLRDEAHADDGAATSRHIRGEVGEAEVKLHRADGSEVWVLVHATPIFDAQGAFEGAFAMFIDMTERRRAEAALRESEARFRALWGSNVVLVWTADGDGRITDVNDAGLAALGYGRHDFTQSARDLRSLVPPEWRAAENEARVQLRALGVASPWQTELRRKDGGRVPILASAVRLDARTEIGIGLDLTEAKRTEGALAERMRVDALTAEIAMHLSRFGTLADRLQAVAESLVRNLDLDLARVWKVVAPSNLELRASAGVWPHVDGPFARLAFGELEIGAVAERGRVVLTTELGGPLRDTPGLPRDRPVGLLAYPLVAGDDLVGVLGLFATVPFTEVELGGVASAADAIAIAVRASAAERRRTELETQLRQSQKMEAVGRLAGGIAHDFNNVLSVILSYADMILSDLHQGDPLREDIDEVRRAASRAADLTRQLLMFSRQQVLEPRVLDLGALLASMEKMLGRLVGEDVAITTRHEAALWPVLADPGSIEQVVMNLVVNARDAMPQGGSIVLETRNVVLDEGGAARVLGASAGEHVLLAVSDTGTGMDDATQGRIFEPFFTTKEQGKGTGLGLSTVFGIVQQSGGHVEVESAPGEGTTMKVYLPRSAVAHEPAVRSLAPVRDGGSETILLVEDEDQVRTVARGILTRSGYAVLDARNGNEALALVARHPGRIDLLVTDVVMPGMGGAELARRLAATKPDLRVLCMSGYTDDSIVRHGVSVAELAYLQKPITPRSLTRKVREVLDAPAPSRRLG